MYSPSYYILHCIWKIFSLTSRAVTKLVNIHFHWASNTSMSMLKWPKWCITREFIFVSLADSCKSFLSQMILEIGGSLSYSCCYVGCYFHEAFDIARSKRCVSSIKFAALILGKCLRWRSVAERLNSYSKQIALDVVRYWCFPDFVHRLKPFSFRINFCGYNISAKGAFKNELFT